jgi:N-acetylneuraminate epimerase
MSFYLEDVIVIRAKKPLRNLDNKLQVSKGFWWAHVHLAKLLILTLLICLKFAHADDWRELAPIPDSEGIAGAFAGVSHDVLLVAGGANFPDKKPWEGGVKVWHDHIYALENPNGSWKIVGRLPRPNGYGVSVSHRQSIVCVGGSNADRHYSETYRLTWVESSSREKGIQVESLPSLPITIANACGAIVGDMLYVAGGLEHPDSSSTLSNVWILDLSSEHPQWREIESVPGSGRMLSVAASFDGTFVLMGGVDLKRTDDGHVERVYLNDAYRYRPSNGWERLPDLPRPVAAAPSPSPTDESGIYILGGDDGSQLGVAPKNHRGFNSAILRFDFLTNQWRTLGTVPASRVTVPCVQWHDRDVGKRAWVIPSGEKQPGIRSPMVWLMTTGTKD